MSLLDKIKRMFGRNPLPDETKLLLSGVDDVAALREGLDQIVTRNEVEAREIEREIDNLAKMEDAHKEKVAAGELSQRDKMNALREIKRLRRRMTSLEKRHRIHQDNIDLHLGLFDRITEMEAMELKQVTQSQIEEIAVDYEEKLDKHRDIVAAGKAATGLENLYEDSAERAELAALEREILAEAGVEPAPKEKQSTATERATERTAERKAPLRSPSEEELDAELADLEDEDDDLDDELEAAAESPRSRRSLEEHLAEARTQEEPDEPALELE